MLALGVGLKRSLVKAYLASSSELTCRILRERSGARDFRRVVIVAALGRNNGIANGARLQFNTLQRLGIQTEILDATPALRNPLFRIPHRPGSAYIFHGGGPQTAALVGSVLPHAAGAYRIAYWAWELPDPPADWTGCDRTVSEIWTPSAFSRDSLTRLTGKPIAVVPHHVPADRARVRRPNRPFTVLVMADSRSSLSRKNPEGALQAFHGAFGTSPRARLVLKLGGRDEAWNDFRENCGDLLSGGNVETFRGHLDEAGMAALYRRSDVLLSLHRAEGFGLPMLEAMTHGVPVVATGWSGNLEFMTRVDSHLVPCRLVPVSDVSNIYSGSRWAEPDIEDAARALRRLAEEPDHYARCAAAAHSRALALAPRFPFTDWECDVRALQAAFA
jgi:glycosyltransferase involved in cell wall biosynthesis